jgi:CRP-like cAMP-binding protein
MTRSYTLHDGKEITTWFSMEGDVACGSWDLYRNKAGFEYVETLEETLVYSISIETLNELYKSDIDIANWMRVLQQENFLRLQDIHISRLNLSAYERYEKLMSECPALFHRVTLGHIASFLGITQQSLSRIRAKGYFLT